MRVFLLVVGVLAAFVFVAPAHATWSAPARITTREAGPVAVAVNARGDAVVAWATRRSSTPTSLHVSLRSSAGRLTSRRVWAGRRRGVGGISVVIDRRGEITLAWTAAAGPRGRGDTVLTTYRSRAGRWARPQVVGHSYDEPLSPVDSPQLAAALDGRVLLAWNRSDEWPGPGRPTVAWRSRGHRFGAAHALKRAPKGLGPIPAFDANGAAYISGRCNGVVLRTAPRGRRFRAPVVFSKHALAFDLALGSPGEGLATWIDGYCTRDFAAGDLLGPVHASVLHAGTFGAPLTLTDPSTQAANTTAAAAPAGGGIASWADYTGVFSTQIGPDGTVGSAQPVTGGLVPYTITASGDVILTGDTSFPATPFVQGGVQVVPAGSRTAEPAPATAGELAVAAPTGRAAALTWGSFVSVWRP